MPWPKSSIIRKGLYRRSAAASAGVRTCPSSAPTRSATKKLTNEMVAATS